jgi:pectinesterase
MKYIIAALLLSISIAQSQNSEIHFSVTNPIDIVRTSETVSIDLEGLVQLYPHVRGQAIAIDDRENELPSQMIDNDGDGENDEIIFQSTLRPKQTRDYILKIMRRRSSVPMSSAFGKYMLPREDFAWENDRIAFRIYGSVVAGNVDNGIDVWTKRVRYPIIEKWYNGEEQTPPVSYHTDHGEGADFFSVGKTLGGGSAGILWNGVLKQGGLFSHHRIITNGPIRISFEVYFPNWTLDTMKFLEVKRITLDAGVQLNRIDERFISNAGLKTLTIAAGLAKRKFASAKWGPDNRRLSMWGLTTPDSVNGYLGTAVIFPYARNAAAIEDSVHNMIASEFEKDLSYTYYAGAAWTRLGDIRNEKEWETYLNEFEMRIRNPLVVQLSSPKSNVKGKK